MVQTLRPSQKAALLTLLGGSLVRFPVSLHHGRFWLVQQQRQKCLPGSVFRLRKISTHYGPEVPRENLLYPIVNLCYSLQQQPTVRLQLYSLWMQRACLRPSENCTFLCRICARFIPKHPAKRIQPEPRRQQRALFLPPLQSCFSQSG